MSEQENKEVQEEPQGNQIFVSNLGEIGVDELVEHFKSFEIEPTTVQFFEDRDGNSKGCALVSLVSEEIAATAVEQLNESSIGDRQIAAREDRGSRRRNRRRRQEDDREPQSDPTWLYIGNLDFEVESEDLEGLFADMGTVVTARVIKRKVKGRSLGWGTVKMSTEEEAKNIIETLNGTQFRDRALTVEVLKTEPKRRRNRRRKKKEENEDSETNESEPVENNEPRRRKQRKPKQEEPEEPEPVNECVLYCGNLAWDLGDEDIKNLFSEYGNVVEAEVARERRGNRSRGWGTIEFETKEEAAAALEALNGTEYKERNLDVQIKKTTSRRRSKKPKSRRRQKQTDEPEENDGQQEEKKQRKRKPRKKKTREPTQVDEPEAHIYVGNLPWAVEDQDLDTLAGDYGTVVAVKVTRDKSGRSRGWGTVQYSSSEEATAAIDSLNDTDYEDRKLQVRLDNTVVLKGTVQEPEQE